MDVQAPPPPRCGPRRTGPWTAELLASPLSPGLAQRLGLRQPVQRPAAGRARRQLHRPRRGGRALLAPGRDRLQARCTFPELDCWTGRAQQGSVPQAASGSGSRAASRAACRGVPQCTGWLRCPGRRVCRETTAQVSELAALLQLPPDTLLGLLGPQALQQHAQAPVQPGSQVGPGLLCAALGRAVSLAGAAAGARPEPLTGVIPG